MAPPVAWQTHPPQRPPEVPVKGLRARPEGRPGHGRLGVAHTEVTGFTCRGAGRSPSGMPCLPRHSRVAPNRTTLIFVARFVTRREKAWTRQRGLGTSASSSAISSERRKRKWRSGFGVAAARTGRPAGIDVNAPRCSPSPRSVGRPSTRWKHPPRRHPVALGHAPQCMSGSSHAGSRPQLP